MNRCGNRRSDDRSTSDVVGRAHGRLLVVGAAAALTVAVSLVASLWYAPSARGQPDVTHDPIVRYAAPVTTAVIDPFRPPAHVGAPGNRGLEYGDTDNQVVSAAASGWVTFAGPVAGRKVVTIEHDDGVRTTYTGLLEIWVVEGMAVNQHSAIAIASSEFHFGARLEDHYLDPQVLIDASAEQLRPRLLPPPDGP